MRRSILLLYGLAAVTACNQSADQPAANNAAANAAAPAERHPTYCFFKDAETKAWTASADGQANVTVKGTAHVKDSRYRAELRDPEVQGTKASIWLTITTNNTGFASPDNWWDVTAAIPNAGGVEAVTVMCGKKTVAELPLKRG